MVNTSATPRSDYLVQFFSLFFLLEFDIIIAALSAAAVTFTNGEWLENSVHTELKDTVSRVSRAVEWRYTTFSNIVPIASLCYTFFFATRSQSEFHLYRQRTNIEGRLNEYVCMRRNDMCHITRYESASFAFILKQYAKYSINKSIYSIRFVYRVCSTMSHIIFVL